MVTTNQIQSTVAPISPQTISVAGVPGLYPCSSRRIAAGRGNARRNVWVISLKSPATFVPGLASRRGSGPRGDQSGGLARQRCRAPGSRGIGKPASSRLGDAGTSTGDVQQLSRPKVSINFTNRIESRFRTPAGRFLTGVRFRSLFRRSVTLRSLPRENRISRSSKQNSRSLALLIFARHALANPHAAA